jgi:geranylgeranyl diphosphate synthase type II
MPVASAPAAPVLLAALSKRVGRFLDDALPPAAAPPRRLHEAMRYSVFAGGKRLRPSLVLLACEAAGGRERDAMPAAAAVEMIHTYSLIHDDLPAMDDDDFRRGRPSCHRAFGEATAILAGDALLTLAFETLSRCPADLVPRLVASIADAAGARGMVGGQQADLEGENGRATPALVRFIHRRKTAALLRASVVAGAICGRASPAELRAIERFGENLGLAFQVADDVLDATATTEQLGKTAGKDAASGKATYPAVFGIDRSRREAAALARRAAAALAILGARAAKLREVMRFVVERDA